MNIFNLMCDNLPFYGEITKALDRNFTPCSVTGVSNIHKSHLAAALSRRGKVLVICDDEAACTRFVQDANELWGGEIARVFPAKDFNFAYMEGVSREYEHKRIEALSKLESGECSIIAASAEAAMQGTIPRTP